jgi:acetyl-CoA acyltransferase
MQLTEAYILSSVRTPVGKANRGAFKNARPEHLGAVAVTGAVERVKGLAPEQVQDVIIGCAFPEGPQGMNMARAIAQKAKLPDSVPGVTVNRFCSSGLQTIAQGVAAVQLGHGRLRDRRRHRDHEPRPDGRVLLRPRPRPRRR